MAMHFTAEVPKVELNCSTLLPEGSSIPRSCHFAEYYFARTADDLENTPSTTIFVDSYDNPVLLRKGRGQPSSLCLSPVRIRDSEFAIGAIAYATTVNEILVAGEVGSQKQAITRIATVKNYATDRFCRNVRILHINEVSALQFARESDFGLESPSPDLIELLDEIYTNKPEARDLIARTTIKSIKTACVEILKSSKN